MVGKTTIGLVETVEIGGRKFRARIDTGAQRSSIDRNIAKKLHLSPVLRIVKVKSASGTTTRPVVKGIVKIRNRKILASFTLSDRKHMRFDVLIGRNVLRKGFLIDTTK